MWNSTFFRTALVVPVAVLLGAAGLSGQSSVEETRAMADEIHHRSMAIAEEMNALADLPRVVYLHAESAYLRDWADPKAFECWSTQGLLLAHIGEFDAAAAFLHAAGNVAWSRGDLTAASEAYVNAAWALKEAGRIEEARHLVRLSEEFQPAVEFSAAEPYHLDLENIVP
jgi:tetratricopeptide (TPR) repeat protein